MQEEVELWMRDPLECIEELLSNPAFRDQVRYAPEKAYTDETGETRIYDEMWTGDWWWETQVSDPCRSDDGVKETYQAGIETSAEGGHCCWGHTIDGQDTAYCLQGG
jgi:hypothetical protein